MSASESLGIIVLGANGRMGKTITSLVREAQDLRLAGLVDRAETHAALEQQGCPVADSLEKLRPLSGNVVVIDFSSPQASMAAASVAAERKLPMVIGTTGLDASQQERLRQLAASTPIMWSANMSVGVNVLMAILPAMARALGPAYDIEIAEVHHRRKKDAPSGTALMLGDALARARGWQLEDCRNSCRNGLTGERPDREIGIQALRGGDVVGIHTSYFLGPGEIISVTHQAESRENFARGALRAAVWICGKQPGLYAMTDVLGLEKI